MKAENLQETIVAIATAPGEGAVGIVRVSGPRALAIAQKHFIPRRQIEIIPPFRPLLGEFVCSTSDEKIDQVLFLSFPAPRSYTGEDLVEIHAHGSPVVLRQIVQTLLQEGGRLAEPGEFTKRAFLNGKIDLTQAEAVASLIAAKTDLAARASLAQLEGSLSRQIEALRQQIIDMFVYVEAAIDYPDEDLELLSQGELEKKGTALVEKIASIRQGARYGKLLREGIAIAIVGKPNVGKSSLLNALLNEERAIVTPIAGTTRDTISEYAHIEGIPVRFIDTAGIRESKELVEKEGIERSVKALEQADLILFVCDRSDVWEKEDEAIWERVKNKNVITVANKSDLIQKLSLKNFSLSCEVSAQMRQGLEALRQTILKNIREAEGLFSHEQYVVTLRHEEALRRAEASLKKTLDSLRQGLSGEFVAVDLRAALDDLGEIVGKTTTDDILDKIFSTFCIGK